MRRIMQLVTLIALSFLTLNLYASESISNLYTNIYADALIAQYDKQLDRVTSLDDDELVTVYSKILAARDLIENEGHTHNYKDSSLLSVTKPNVYLSIVEKVEKRSIEIKKHITRVRNLQKSNSTSVLYPAIDGHGNITGNTFPTNSWALTFDDGPHASRTKMVVDNLYLHQLKASFFMLMKQVNKYPEALDYVIENDMELALHSYNHLNLAKADPETVVYEISTAKSELEHASDKEISLFRLPYGSGMRDSALRTVIAKEKMFHIFWNVDTLDWKDKNPESIVARTIKQMNLTPKKSGVILFHDIHAQTVIASEKIMQYMNDNKKKVCLLTDFIKYHNSQEQDCL